MLIIYNYSFSNQLCSAELDWQKKPTEIVQKYYNDIVEFTTIIKDLFSKENGCVNEIITGEESSVGDKDRLLNRLIDYLKCKGAKNICVDEDGRYNIPHNIRDSLLVHVIGTNIVNQYVLSMPMFVGKNKGEFETEFFFKNESLKMILDLVVEVSKAIPVNINDWRDKVFDVVFTKQKQLDGNNHNCLIKIAN